MISQVAGVGLVLTVAVGVWLVSWPPDEPPAPALPDMATQFSLDLKIIGEVDADPVFVVEQRAQPNYRIFAFDPISGEQQTIYSVPESSVIQGLALSPDRSTLAVAYADNYGVDGNQLVMLDVASGEIESITTAQLGHWLVDLVWAPGGDEVYATEVVNADDGERLSVVGIDASSGEETMRADNAMNPAPTGDAVLVLDVGQQNARSLIRNVAADGSDANLEVSEGLVDLDHLLYDAEADVAIVAVLKGADSSGVALGAQADAHGSHDVVSTWWAGSVAGGQSSSIGSEPDSDVVYDAVISGDWIVSVTGEGLSFEDVGIASGDPKFEPRLVDVVFSRALRFVAG